MDSIVIKLITYNCVQYRIIWQIHRGMDYHITFLYISHIHSSLLSNTTWWINMMHMPIDKMHVKNLLCKGKSLTSNRAKDEAKHIVFTLRDMTYSSEKITAKTDWPGHKWPFNICLHFTYPLSVADLTPPGGLIVFWKLMVAIMVVTMLRFPLMLVSHLSLVLIVIQLLIFSIVFFHHFFSSIKFSSIVTVTSFSIVTITFSSFVAGKVSSIVIVKFSSILIFLSVCLWEQVVTQSHVP